MPGATDRRGLLQSSTALRVNEPQVHVVDAIPFHERPPKGATYGVLSAVSIRFVISNVCNRNPCALPPAVANLKPGETVRVWRDALTVWQLEAAN